MKLTANLAYRQLKINRKRRIWTLIGIALSTAMITAVYGFAASGIEAAYGLIHGNLRREYVVTFVGIGVILSIIIVTASVIVVSNSFRVSAGERLMQFGILKSVGATKKQIAGTIMYESLYLSAIGIPAGIILGLLVQLAGLEIANSLLGNLGTATNYDVVFDYVIAWQAILFSIAVAFVTVLLSAWLPARKAAKIPAIDAIRRDGEVKIKRSQARPGRLVKKLFGFEGTLASKSLKRSRRNFRATVVSLTISIVLFVAASSFGTHLNRMANVVLHPTRADVFGRFNTSEISTETNGVFQREYVTIDNETAEIITARLREFPGATILGAGSNRSSFRGGIPAIIPEDMLTQNMRNILEPRDGVFSMSVTFVTVDAETYAELCRLAGVPLGSNILVNYVRRFVEDRWMEFTPFVFNYQTLQTMSGDEFVDLPLHGELREDQIPRGVIHVSGAHFSGGLVVIVPQLDSLRYYWLAETDDPYGLTMFMSSVLNEYIPPLARDSIVDVSVHVHNIVAEENLERNIIRLVMVFIYGFVGMLTLIGLTNVISTISTNVRSRSREFAVLRSVGMTHGGLNRMLNLESILCSVKSLIIGLPLGIAASYLIYQFILQSVYFSYSFPWLAVVQSVLAVFVITWVTMRYCATRLRGKNIVETIRAESGM